MVNYEDVIEPILRHYIRICMEKLIQSMKKSV